MLAPLRHRNYVLFWSSVFVSMMGDWVMAVGLPIYVYTLTRSVLATGFMVIAGRVPRILIGPIAGVLADRWDRKHLMVGTNAIQALTVLLLLLVRDASHMWIVYVATALQSAVDQLLIPSGSALLPSLVDEGELVAANSLMGISFNSAKLVGPAVGGILAVGFGLRGFVIVDSISFALAAVLLGMMVLPPSVRRIRSVRAGEANAWREWVDGLRMSTSTRILRTLLSGTLLTSFGDSFAMVLFPVFIVRVLHAGPKQLGLYMSGQAVGGLVGGVVFGALGRRTLSRVVLGTCGILCGLLAISVYTLPSVHMSPSLELVLFALLGVPTIGLGMGFQSLSQLAAPPAFRGRVNSTRMMTMQLVGLVGASVATGLGTRFDLVPLISVHGVAYLVTGLFALFFLSRDLLPRS